MTDDELSEILKSGDIEEIRSVLDSGTDIRYVRPEGYVAMIDVMHGRSRLEAHRLLPVLRLLIDRGADLDAESDYGESALSITSRVGRFDAVALLLESGANPRPLGWTALHRAIALDTVEDVKRRLESGDDLEARDCWDRTPMLLSLMSRDIEKARLILASGGSLTDQGRCGMTSPMYPIAVDDPAMLKWLLKQGADADAVDNFGDTPLRPAAESGSAECLRILVEAGANVNDDGPYGSTISSSASLECARILAKAGANMAEIHRTVRDEITRVRRTVSIDCSQEEYHVAKYRIFGNANPQRMNFPFWKAMVACGDSGYGARKHFDNGQAHDEPVWCFQRMGQSFTELPDGRVIEIAGEHEDFYDPDFCIYNDVTVHHGDGMFDIYGYPREVFPPTDFHTATLVGDSIYVIGSLGYDTDRKHGTTQVFRLDIHSLMIERIDTNGESPGWISHHKARLLDNGIEVTGGEILCLVDSNETSEYNRGFFMLNLDTLTWSKSN